MILDLLQLAQPDPTAVAEKLANAQSIQEVLAWCVGILLVGIVLVTGFWLKERKAWGEKETAIVKAHGEEKIALAASYAAEKSDILARWGEAKISWEQERLRHSDEKSAMAAATSEKVESLMREMLNMALQIKEALTSLASKGE